MVCPGLTDFDPLVAEPMLSMVTVSAPVDDHVSVLDCPRVIVDGVALAWIVGAGTGVLELGEPELGEPELGEPELEEPEPGAMPVAPFNPRHPTIQKLMRSKRKQDNALQLRANIGQLRFLAQTDG